MAERKYPSERRARRDSWRPGVPIVLADGKEWHLPALDEGLIPYLPRLVPVAESIMANYALMHDGPGFDPAWEVARSWRGVFVVHLLAIQYRTRRDTLIDLCANEDDAAFLEAVAAYHETFNHWVVGRYPVGFDGAGLLAGMQ
jgi:hypothetical protein